MASFAANRETAPIAVRDEHSPGRTWAWLGLAAAIAGFVVTWGLQFLISQGELEAGGDRLFDSLNSERNEVLFRVSSGLGYLVVAALVAFAAGLRGLLEARAEGDRTLPNVVFGSILVTAAALGLAMSFRAQVFDGLDYYQDSTASHITMNRLQQDSVLAAWATMLAATVAVAVAGLRGRVFPRAIGWFSAVISLLVLVAVMTGLPFPANVPVLLWLGTISIWAIRATGSAPR